jgi:ABC-type antimicrobial peptide transport system permease subunit
LKDGLLLTSIGVGVGLVLSAAAGRVFGSFLFGVTPTDTAAYLAVTGLLAVVSLAACYLPARRASKADPMLALRAD